MARKFTITTPAETVRVGANGRAEMVFTVTNTRSTPDRALVRAMPLGSTRGEWLSVAGESEREFGPGAVQQFTVAAQVPPGTPPGRYTYRLDVLAAQRGGEEREEGPTVAIEVAASEAPKKRSLWWLWIVLGVLLVVGAVVAFLVLRPDDDKPPTVTPVDPRAEVPRAGVALWLIADEAQPSPGTTKIDFWQNAELPGVRASAVKIAAQPELVRNAVNDHAVLRFDGDDMLMTNVPFGRGKMAAATVFTVFSSATNATVPYRKLYGCDDGGFDPAVGLDNRSPTANYVVFTGGGVHPYFTLSANRYTLTTDHFQWTQFTGYVDGKLVVNAVPTSHDTQTLPNLYIGGTGLVWVEPWLGDIAEMIVYSRSLDDAERRKVEDYLASKYRLTLSR